MLRFLTGETPTFFPTCICLVMGLQCSKSKPSASTSNKSQAVPCHKLSLLGGNVEELIHRIDHCTIGYSHILDVSTAEDVVF